MIFTNSQQQGGCGFYGPRWPFCMVYMFSSRLGSFSPGALAPLLPNTRDINIGLIGDSRMASVVSVDGCLSAYMALQ